MRRLGTALVSCALLAITTSMSADGGGLKARASGANEVPAINTAGTAEFNARIHSDGTIDFTLDFQNLSSALTASHIHFAQKNVSGGVMIWLCGGGGPPVCPAATSGSSTGHITAANVSGPTSQGIAAGDLAAALGVVDAGLGYANLHTTKFPAGEIRGQVKGNVTGNDKD